MADEFIRFDRRDPELFESSLVNKQCTTDLESGLEFFLFEFRRNKCKDWSIEINQDLAATFYWPAFSRKDAGHNRIQRPAISVKFEYPYQFSVVSVNLNRLADERAINPPSEVFSAYQDAAGKDHGGAVVDTVVAAIEKVHPGTKDKFAANRKFAESLPKSDTGTRRSSVDMVEL